MKQSKKAGRLKALSLFSIVLAVAIAGTASMASADGIPGIPEPHNQFYGTITLNGVDAPAGTIVRAYVGNEPRGNITATISGRYGSNLTYLSVQGTNGEIITFTVAGVLAVETAPWNASSGPRELNLTAGDHDPFVSAPDANPNSMAATGHTATAEPTEPEPSDESETFDESATGDAEETATTETEMEGDVATDGKETPITEFKTNAPGFSAFLVIAGLLAAMYLVLRRRD